MSNSLSKELRNQLAKVTLEARVRADEAVRAALENMAVHEKDYRPHMGVAERALRNRLRAKGRALGDARDDRTGTQQIDRLAEQGAYEHWHRLLFTRFLVENDLLYSDEKFGSVPVTLQECDALASETGARDGFDLACRFASRTLPGVFRQDDPVLELRLAANDESALRKLLQSLPREVFRSDDGLGWTYQFWQAQRKDEVNASGTKIGAEELPAVTQLFTEDYMVEFLLHNTLGAWWAGRLGPIRAETEEEARAKTALRLKDGLGVTWTYLRLVRDDQAKTWTPAAGTSSGWPTQAKLIRFLDPCMGSGHFPVFALPLLARMRMEEEGLSAAQAVRATLGDNLFGLEIDERCTQIGAFNVALAAWKICGYQPLPSLQIACSGLAPHAAEKDWVALAGGDERIKTGMARLYSLFREAPILGSLINPRELGGNLIEAQFNELQPLLGRALAVEAKDDSSHEMAVTARGLANAAEILAGQFTLVATNVPYLARGKQNDALREYCDRAFPESKADLATCFVERCMDMCAKGGTSALVTPENWLYQDAYSGFRRHLLRTWSAGCIARLGAGAFGAVGGWDVNIALFTVSKNPPSEVVRVALVEAAPLPDVRAKANTIRDGQMATVGQTNQLKNPDARIGVAASGEFPLLSQFATFANGLQTGDYPRFVRCFWELPNATKDWSWFQTTIERTTPFDGLHFIVYWQEGNGILAHSDSSVVRGTAAWGKPGIAVSAMGALQVTIYSGQLYDDNTVVITPRKEPDLPAIWAFCASDSYAKEVRRLDRSLKVRAPLVKVPFDKTHWADVASSKYPHGLPKPHSSDPTQWLFDGRPPGADQPCHVAIARLLGYKWPRQTGAQFPDCSLVSPDGLDKLADEDGVVCLPPINREQPAAQRLRALLGKALGNFDERALVAAAGLNGSKSTTLEDWLHDELFEQHSQMFHQRPFIWHVWDGRRDGFHALVNYHKLDHDALQKLTYSYLGDWIRQQTADAKADKPGAADRLGAAQALQAELANILEGKPPYNIFVRWKPLAKQPIGWHPDLNDGVPINIRPFMLATDLGKKGAGVLRARPNIKWDKDRGKEPHRDKTHTVVLVRGRTWNGPVTGQVLCGQPLE